MRHEARDAKEGEREATAGATPPPPAAEQPRKAALAHRARLADGVDGAHAAGPRRRYPGRDEQGHEGDERGQGDDLWLHHEGDADLGAQDCRETALREREGRRRTGDAEGKPQRDAHTTQHESLGQDGAPQLPPAGPDAREQAKLAHALGHRDGEARVDERGGGDHHHGREDGGKRPEGAPDGAIVGHALVAEQVVVQQVAGGVRVDLGGARGRASLARGHRTGEQRVRPALEVVVAREVRAEVGRGEALGGACGRGPGEGDRAGGRGLVVAKVRRVVVGCEEPHHGVGALAKVLERLGARVPAVLGRGVGVHDREDRGGARLVIGEDAVSQFERHGGAQVDGGVCRDARAGGREGAHALGQRDLVGGLGKPARADRGGLREAHVSRVPGAHGLGVAL